MKPSKAFKVAVFALLLANIVGQWILVARYEAVNEELQAALGKCMGFTEGRIIIRRKHESRRNDT